MMSEREKFVTLFSHEVEHNVRHAEEFRELAEKAREIGEKLVCDDILVGVEQMNKANELFAAALEKLGRQGGA